MTNKVDLNVIIDRAFISASTGIADLRNICIELAKQVDFLTNKLNEVQNKGNGSQDFTRKGQFVEREAIKGK